MGGAQNDPKAYETIVARGPAAKRRVSKDGGASSLSDGGVRLGGNGKGDVLSPTTNVLADGSAGPTGSVARHGGRPTLRHVLVAALWLALWQVGATVVGSPLILPGPVAVCARVAELGSTSTFWLTVANTLGRVALGYVLAFVLALVAGIAASRWSMLSDILRPPLAVLRAAPIVCVIVLLLMWVGSRGVPLIAAFVVAFPPTYFAVREGMAGLDVRKKELLRIFRAGRAVRMLAQVWPGIAPYVAAASETSCSMALKAGVAAELIGSPVGTVGERIYQAKLLLETADVLAWTLVVVLVAAMLSHAFVALLRRSAGAAMRAAVSLAVRFGPEKRAPTEGIACEGVTVAYGPHVVIGELSLALAPGERVVMTDASGAGKTTLLRALAGLKDAVAGSVRVPTTSIVFQDARLFDDLSSVDNVCLLSGASPSEAAVALGEVLPGVDVGMPVRALSGGQRRRVELVRALLAPSGAVLLDEPFASLDDEARAACCRFVLARLGGRTLVVASHDASDARLLDASPMSLV